MVVLIGAIEEVENYYHDYFGDVYCGGYSWNEEFILFCLPGRTGGLKHPVQYNVCRSQIDVFSQKVLKRSSHWSGPRTDETGDFPL